MYDKLIAYLDQHQAQYRLIQHEAEGRTDVVTNQGEVDDLLASLGF